MDSNRLDDLARRLGEAWARAAAIPAPTLALPGLTVHDAYAIQDAIVAARLGGSRTRAGWKMGLTSAQPPATPIVGTLLSDMVVPSGAQLGLSTMVGPLVEAEVVIRIGETIEAPQTLAELARGPHEIGPGIEVIDYRTTDSTGVVDWIADNSTVAYAVVGDFVPVAATDAAEVAATLSRDGTELASGEGKLVMGNPLAAVAWLSEHLIERGQPLERGHVVLTGSLTGHHIVPTDRASQFTADFGELGRVDVAFEP